MSFAGFDEGPEARPMAEINMIPLIDVMLVLLIVFMVTAPLLTQAVRVDLPRADSRPELHHPDDLNLALKADGSVYWNDAAVTAADLPGLMARAAATNPTPELHLRADRAVPYGRVAQIMAQAAHAGLDRIGFISDPADTPPSLP